MCQSALNSAPVKVAFGSANAFEALFSTRGLDPAGEGRPTMVLTAASSDPSPFGPHPLAAGTENVLSPWVTGATTMVNSGPFGLAVPFGSNDWPNGIACEMSVFAGCRTIGFASEPMKQLGPRWIGGTPSRWILIGSVMIGTPVESPASRSKSDGSPADETVAKTAIPPAVTMTGSEMTAPPAGDTMLNTLVFESNTMPTCRLVLPV